jgi:hypothetical protein
MHMPGAGTGQCHPNGLWGGDRFGSAGDDPKRLERV